jgi:hypothetical protein
MIFEWKQWLCQLWFFPAQSAEPFAYSFLTDTQLLGDPPIGEPFCFEAVNCSRTGDRQSRPSFRESTWTPQCHQPTFVEARLIAA